MLDEEDTLLQYKFLFPNYIQMKSHPTEGIRNQLIVFGEHSSTGH